MRLATRTATARPGPMVSVMAQVAKGSHAGIDDELDRPAGAAVASIGSTARDVSLTSERSGSVATRAAGYEDPDLVSEHGGR